MTGLCFALAAGGTGGHVFPAESLGEVLAARNHRVLMLTDRRGRGFDRPDRPWELHRIRASSPSRPGVAARLGALAQIGLGTLDARRILARSGTNAVVGFGGYPSVPVVLAAATLGIPSVLHEQNAVLGRANRMLAGRARLIATSIEPTRGAGARKGRLRHTGNPVRAAIQARRCAAYTPPKSGEPLDLLVFGGSLGARVLSDVVPAAVSALPTACRERLRIVQQCRGEDVERVTAAYRDLPNPPEIATFFDDMPDRFVRAHLVIARAGASTVAELAVIGRPAVLVPYPHAMDAHQDWNARALEQAGAAWRIDESDLDASVLADCLAGLLQDPDQLAAAAAAAFRVGRPGAADALAELVLQAAGAASTTRDGERTTA